MFYFGKTMLFRGIVNFRAKLSAEGRLSRPIHTSAALPAASGNSGTGGTLSLTLSYLSLLCAEPALVLGIVTVLSCLSGLPFFFHLKIVRHHGRWTLFHMSTGRDFSAKVCPMAFSKCHRPRKHNKIAPGGAQNAFHLARFSVSVCTGGLSCAWQQNIIYS